MGRSESEYKQIADRIKLMAHPERLRILDALRNHPQCVCHLETLLQRPQPYISQQVRLLSRADVLESERQGTNIYYYVADPGFSDWLAAVLGPAITGREHQFVENCPCPKCVAMRPPATIELVIDHKVENS